MLKHSAPHWAFLPRVERGLQPGPGTLRSVAKAAGTTRQHTVLLSPLHLDAGILSTLGRQLHLCLATWTARLRVWGCSTAGWWGHLVFTISHRGVIQGTHCSGREPLCLLPSDEHLPSLELHFVVHCFLNAIYFGNALRGKPRAQSQPLCRVAAAT